jgi:hypothetical protein
MMLCLTMAQKQQNQPTVEVVCRKKSFLPQVAFLGYFVMVMKSLNNTLGKPGGGQYTTQVDSMVCETVCEKGEEVGVTESCCSLT